MEYTELNEDTLHAVMDRVKVIEARDSRTHFQLPGYECTFHFGARGFYWFETDKVPHCGLCYPTGPFPSHQLAARHGFVSQLKVRAGRCHYCKVVWAWKPAQAAVVSSARCPGCGFALRQTTLPNIRRVPIKIGFPWYSAATGPRGLGTQYKHATNRIAHHDPRYWHTFQVEPDTGRVLKAWAPADIDPPEWLREVTR